jgi:hypothetical protein
MTYGLPESFDIETEIDGRCFDGAYSIVFGDLVVYYNGHTSSARKPQTNTREIAIRMLQELVRVHYVEIDLIPSDLPERIRNAAFEYVNSFDDDEPIRKLIQAFGESTVGSEVHTQISWLCVNALQPIVPFWKAMCDDDGPERTLADLRLWLKDRSHSVDWESARQPALALCDGIKIEDCDACRAEPIAKAVANCADYLQTADTDAAVKTILHAWGAHAEGCWPQDEERPFERWFVEVALPNALRCRSTN